MVVSMAIMEVHVIDSKVIRSTWGRATQAGSRYQRWGHSWGPHLEECSARACRSLVTISDLLVLLLPDLVGGGKGWEAVG